jgi:hypothetical protein
MEKTALQHSSYREQYTTLMIRRRGRCAIWIDCRSMGWLGRPISAQEALIQLWPDKDQNN